MNPDDVYGDYKPVDLYRELTSLPVPDAAQFASPEVLVLTLAAQDHVRNAKRFVKKSIILSSPPLTSPCPFESTDAASLWSPSGRYRAVLQEVSDSDAPAGKKRYVEIWENSRLHVSKDVTSIHGSFYATHPLSAFCFSPAESAIVYTAEGNETSADDDKLGDSPETYRWKPDLGESWRGKRNLTTFLFRWDSSADLTPRVSLSALSPAEAPPVPTLFGQAVFASESRIFATGFEQTKDGRLLGLVWCRNRPMGIWELLLPDQDVDSSAKDTPVVLKCAARKLTAPERSCKCPRVLGDTLFWLSDQIGGAHAACTSLVSLNLSTGEEKLLVDTVWEPSPPNAFPGIYTESLPTQPFLWIDHKPFLVTTSTWRSRSTLLLIGAQDGAVTDLTPAGRWGQVSFKVLCTDGERRIVCARSAPTVPSVTMIALVRGDFSATWEFLEGPTLKPMMRKLLDTLEVSVIKVPGRHPTEIIVTRPKSDDGEVLPCVTCPHGGPHSSFGVEFNPFMLTIALQGYVVSQVNYTGSTGFGEKFVQELRGRCGTLDVQDCMASIEYLIRLGIAERNPRKQFLVGGSHGGFLAIHLIGQYPDFFDAAIVRNPVISCEPASSDIPDWYYAEFGLPFGPESVMTPALYEKLYGMSPIAHVGGIRARVLLQMGAMDARVAPTHALALYHALKGRGRTVEMLCFPKSGHALDGAQVERVCVGAIVDWLKGAK